jgi:hypothetical protein
VNSEIFRTVLDDQPFEDRDPRDDRLDSLGLYAKVKELELEQVNNLVVALMSDRLRHIDEPTARKLLAIFTATTDDSLDSLRQAAAEEKLVSTMRTLDLANHMINTAYGELGEVEDAQQRVKAAMEPLKAMIKNSLTGFETDVKTFKNEVEHLQLNYGLKWQESGNPYKHNLTFHEAGPTYDGWKPAPTHTQLPASKAAGLVDATLSQIL